MINERALRDTLVQLAEYAKAQNAAITTLTNELAALRETVRALDPAFAEVLDQKRAEMAQASRPAAQLSDQHISALIAALTRGEVC